MSNWALKGVLEENKIGMFIQSKFDIKDEDLNSRGNWNRFIVDESIEVPIFLEKYKNNILQCGKTINFYNQFNNLVRINKYKVFKLNYLICLIICFVECVFTRFNLLF